MGHTFNQVIALGDVREQLVEVRVAFAAGHSETGDGHEVRRDVVHIVGRLVVGPFIVGGTLAGLDEGRSSGTPSRSVSGKFEGGPQLVVFGDG